MAVVRVKKDGGGGGGCCLLKIFLVLIILALVLVVGALGSLWWGMKTVQTKYSSPDPIPLAYPVPEAGELEAIKARVEAFEANTAESPAELALTGRELNLLIGNDPELAPVKDRMFAKLADDTASVVVSIPAAWQFFTGNPVPPDARHVNAVVHLEATAPGVDNGGLRVRVNRLMAESKGFTKPQLDQFKDQMNQVLAEISAENAISDPGTYTTLEGGKLIMRRAPEFRGAGAAPATDSMPDAPAMPEAAPAPEPETVPNSVP